MVPAPQPTLNLPLYNCCAAAPSGTMKALVCSLSGGPWYVSKQKVVGMHQKDLCVPQGSVQVSLGPPVLLCKADALAGQLEGQPESISHHLAARSWAAFWAAVLTDIFAGIGG